MDIAGLAGVGATVALAGVTLSGYLSDTPAAQDKQVRSLSQMMSSGQELPREYSSVRVNAGNTPFATLEERAAMEGSVFDGGEEAVAALDRLQAGFSVQASALGEGEGGLGMGQNLAAAIDAGGQGGNGAQAGAAAADAAVASAIAGKTKINKLSDGPQGGLERASIARASGSNLGSGGGVSGGGVISSANLKASASADRQARIGASSISGNMPSGTTLVASNTGIRAAASASFGADHNARIGSGINSTDGKSLREIAVGSAKAAANANRSVNEGVRPFMASQQLSGGVNVEGDVNNLPQANSSFEDDLKAKENRLGKAKQDNLEDQLKKEAHRTRLQKMLFATLITTLVAMAGIGALMKSGTPWAYVGAAAVALIALGIIGVFMADAIKYIKEYGWDGWSTAAIVMSGLYIGGIGISFIPAVGEAMAGALEKCFSSTFGQIVVGAIASTGVGMSVNTAVESIQAWNDEGSDGLKNK